MDRPRVMVIDDRLGDAERLCHALNVQGLAAEAMSLTVFLAPPAGLALLLGPPIAAVLVDVPAISTDAYWRRVSVLRRLARLFEVPLVITTAPHDDWIAPIEDATVIEVRGGIETLAAAVARFVRPQHAPAASAWNAA
jgi:hypothetical protein